MTPTSRIYIAGHRGLVGSAIVRRLQAAGHSNLLLRTHAELDLTDVDACGGVHGRVGGLSFSNKQVPA